MTNVEMHNLDSGPCTIPPCEVDEYSYITLKPSKPQELQKIQAENANEYSYAGPLVDENDQYSYIELVTANAGSGVKLCQNMD